ncbi:MAG: hypothetical protein SOY64_01805 [Pyramidobacter sp.]|uniref:hypothetical protein n=1 Tax=Pyramidobacter sp. TaxID=1943581 RepID=UPI002A7EC9D6|nr:hypothetical protein [Pyramidobacter sp.]MDY4031788.1 hypothetical protein [Pyramidobacter sp.]
MERSDSFHGIFVRHEGSGGDSKRTEGGKGRPQSRFRAWIRALPFFASRLFHAGQVIHHDEVDRVNVEVLHFLTDGVQVLDGIDRDAGLIGDQLFFDL